MTDEGNRAGSPVETIVARATAVRARDRRSCLWSTFGWLCSLLFLVCLDVLHQLLDILLCASDKDLAVVQHDGGDESDKEERFEEQADRTDHQD